MKILLLIISILVIQTNELYAESISGKINHNDVNFENKIIDSKTKEVIKDAKITIPELHYTTYSDKNGCFKLNAGINDKTVLLIEKDGYKTFSLTIDNNVLNTPLKLGIEKSSPLDLQITQGVIHLGDNMFSTNSANSGDFKLNANGHFLSKIFQTPKYTPTQDVILSIGTIIGLDTKKAKELGQNKISEVYSSPMEILLNGKRIQYIHLNGDNIEIKLPKTLLKSNNEIIIRTGKNLFQTQYTDYDDVELANIRIEVKNNGVFAQRN